MGHLCLDLAENEAGAGGLREVLRSLVVEAEEDQVYHEMEEEALEALKMPNCC